MDARRELLAWAASLTPEEIERMRVRLLLAGLLSAKGLTLERAVAEAIESDLERCRATPQCGLLRVLKT